MPAPSRRIVLALAAASLLAMLAAFLGGLTLARSAWLPPVPNTRFVSYNGLHPYGSCVNYPPARTSGLFWCNWGIHADSLLAVVGHDPAAAAWCGQWVDDFEHNHLPAIQLGPLRLSLFPPVMMGPTGCADAIPLSVGVDVEIFFQH